MSLLKPASPPWVKSMSLYFTCFPAMKWKIAKTNAIIPHIPSFLLQPAASAPPDSMAGKAGWEAGKVLTFHKRWNIGVLSRLFLAQIQNIAPSKRRQKKPQPQNPNLHPSQNQNTTFKSIAFTWGFGVEKGWLCFWFSSPFTINSQVFSFWKWEGLFW